jgi:hypothetical protein
MRIKKMSASQSPPSDHEYRIPDEEASTIVDDVLVVSEDANTSRETPKGASANEEDLSMVVKKLERSPSKCVVSEKKQRVSIALPIDEIERDFVAITSKKPLVKRPKRSPSKCVVSEKKQIVSIALPNDEIARDFVAITGKKPLKKPMKRSKIVQEEMDRLFSGSGLGPIILGLLQRS